MSHFTRFNKAAELRKASAFESMDGGGKDAGAKSTYPHEVTPSPVGHMHTIGMQHSHEADLHGNISDNLSRVGFDKAAAAHKQIATEHSLAAQHYHAAAESIVNAADKAGDSNMAKHVDAASDHLKAARAGAAKAKELTTAMNK